MSTRAWACFYTTNLIKVCGPRRMLVRQYSIYLNRMTHFVVLQIILIPNVSYTNSFVTFLSWIYWLGTHAFNAAGHMGALL